MAREGKLNRLETVRFDLGYPIVRAAAADAFEDVTLVLAEGQVNLGGSSGGAFESLDDLANEVRSGLPCHTVGEPLRPEGGG